jgi:ribosome biogenesis GTPase / thiamine phosphate phosphatase
MATRRWDKRAAKILEPSKDAVRGVVVAHYGVAVDVELHSGERRSVRVARRSGHVVGDAVLVDGERLSRQPRDNELRRRSPGGGEHVVAANLDLLLIVLAPVPPPRTGLVDRAVVAARSAGIEPALLVTKIDLEEGPDILDILREVFEPSLPVLGVSAVTGEGTDALRALIAGRGRALLTGHSGVGKSSMTNRLVPGLSLTTKTLSEASGRGRHTTTVATLHRLPSGGELVDTPGIKEFGLTAGVTPAELARCFAGFERARETSCRFRDCLHETEPGCAVREAAARGDVDPERLVAYRALLHEIATGSDPRA